jgi:predicted nucleic acid-binding protein
MDVKDELSELWCSQICASATTKEEIAMLVEKKTRQFDRLILVRNALESVSALAVTVIFAAMAAQARDALQRTGLLIVAASGLWIIAFLLRYGRASLAADPAQELSRYRRALVERYDREIRLLKSVKYWYLLPPWIGLLIGSAGVMLHEYRNGRLGWYDFIAPAIYTAFFTFVWWLNEVYGVAHLRAERARVLAIEGENGEPEN